MNIRQMRFTDTYVGGLVCLFLEIYEKTRRLFSFNSPASRVPVDPKKILITKYLGMGSILLATPMLKALRLKFPESKIVFLTFQKNAKFAEQIELVDEVLSIRTSSYFVFMADLLDMLCKVRKAKFDAVLDLEFFARFSTIVSYLSGAKIRIGYYLPRLWRGELLTSLAHFNPYKHVTEIFSSQLKPFNIEVSDFTLTPPRVRESKMADVNSLLGKKGINKEERHIVAINTNSSDLSVERRWPIENFAELIKYIIMHKKMATLILVGSREDKAYVEKIYELLPREFNDCIINLCGDIDIEEFIALLKICGLFITNDSGPLHIASALGVPTVSFFGPETPLLYGPIGEKSKVFYAGIYCSPCLSVYNAKTAMCKGDNRCMKEIRARHVIDTLVKEGIL